MDKRGQIHKCLFYMGFFVSTVSTRLKVSTRGQTPPPPSPPTVDEPVFAACRTPAGRWSIVAPGCRELSGRTGLCRVAVLDEPAAGGAEVIKLEERRRT